MKKFIAISFLIVGVGCSYFIEDIDDNNKTPLHCGGEVCIKGRSRVECALYCIRHGQQVSYRDGVCYCYQATTECSSASSPTYKEDISQPVSYVSLSISLISTQTSLSQIRCSLRHFLITSNKMLLRTQLKCFS